MTSAFDARGESFLWVIQDDSSVAKKRSGLSFKSRSHMMLEALRKRKIRNLTNEPEPRERSETPPAYREIVFASKSELSKGSAKRKPAGRGKSTGDALTVEQSPSQHPTLGRLNGGSDDPFSSASVPLDSWLHFLIRYHLNVCLPAIFAIRPDNVQAWQQSSGFLADLTEGLADSAHIYSVLAMSAAHMEHARTKSPYPDERSLDQNSRNSTYFKMKCIQELRPKISDKAVDLYMRRSIMNLAAAEAFAGDRNAQMIHIGAWAHLALTMGETPQFQRQATENALFTDIKTAFPMLTQTNLPTNFGVAQLPEKSKMRPIPLETTVLGSLGRRLTDQQSTAILEPDFQAIIRDSREILLRHEYLREHPRDTGPIELEWISISILNLKYRLTAYPVKHPELRPIQNCCRIAALIFECRAFSDVLTDVILETEVRHLKRAIIESRSSDQDFWAPYSDFLLWCLCVGLQASGAMPDEYGWFAEQTVSVANHLELTGADVPPVLRGFLYLDRVHVAALKILLR